MKSITYANERKEMEQRVKRQIEIHPQTLLRLDTWTELKNEDRKGKRGVKNYNRSDAVSFALFYGMKELQRDTILMLDAKRKAREAQQRRDAAQLQNQ